MYTRGNKPTNNVNLQVFSQMSDRTVGSEECVQLGGLNAGT
jgi:hypothetical protein